ncbi:MAG: hypothetical protein NTW25_08155 [Candidatus Kapabacteria bacterium]|nr:hypothetical protein [Candidatus Kapabacteria bacterium]
MKKIIFILTAFVFLQACKDATLDPNSLNNSNPFYDSTNIKFSFVVSSIEAWGEGSSYGSAEIIYFNGDYKHYEIICGKNQYKDFNYLLISKHAINLSFLDSLDNIFISSNVDSYPNSLPYGTDSTTVWMWPSSEEEFSWRKSKNNKFKNFTATTGAHGGNYKFPENYDLFNKKLDSLLFTEHKF